MSGTSRPGWDLGGARKRGDDLRQRHSEIVDQQDRLLNLRLLEEIEADTYAQKATELRDEETHLSLEMERLTRERYEIADIAVKAFELSQDLRAKWFNADYAAKRRILEITCLNFSLDGVTLVPVMRKPFDMLAEGLDLKNSRGDWI
jgi:site-specific DNA recombinase